MIRLVLAGVLVACSSRSTTPAHPPPHSAGTAAVASEHGGRSDAQCDALFAHVVGLAIDERPADQHLNEDERGALRAQLRSRWLPSCRTMTTAGYDCALAAHTVAELDACSK